MLTARFKVTLKGDLKGLDKQTSFALASSLTLMAKEVQAAEPKELRGAFTVRTDWDKPSNVFGFRVKPATKTNLVAVVGTAADWIEKFVEKDPGSFVVKLPQGEFIAIPTKNARRTKRDVLRKNQRPKALIGKRDFVITTRRGINVVFQRKGRGARSEMIAMYILVHRARIQEKDVLFGLSQRLFTKRFAPIFEQQMERAFATAR